MKNKLFGIPVAAEVRLLSEKVGTPSPGDTILYSRIEEAITLMRDDNRFKTVLLRWRQMLYREHNLVLEAIRGEGFRVLEAADRIDHSVRKTASAARGLAKAYAVAATTPRKDLSATDTRRLDHQIHLTGELIRLGHKIDKTQATIESPTKTKTIWSLPKK